eukprot:scaffold8283_cov258-Pinguiococcus_pyrenoidosus.AAC.2
MLPRRQRDSSDLLPNRCSFVGSHIIQPRQDLVHHCRLPLCAPPLFHSVGSPVEYGVWGIVRHAVVQHEMNIVAELFERGVLRRQASDGG